MVSLFESSAVFRDDSTTIKVDDLTFYSLVKIKKNFSTTDETQTAKKALPTHKEKLLEMLTKEIDQDVVDKG